MQRLWQDVSRISTRSSQEELQKTVTKLFMRGPLRESPKTVIKGPAAVGVGPTRSWYKNLQKASQNSSHTSTSDTFAKSSCKDLHVVQACAIETQMHMAQEPFHARIYRKNAGSQVEHPDQAPTFRLPTRIPQCQCGHCLGKVKAPFGNVYQQKWSNMIWPYTTQEIPDLNGSNAITPKKHILWAVYEQHVAV